MASGFNRVVAIGPAYLERGQGAPAIREENRLALPCAFMNTIDDALYRGLRHHEAGQLAEAQALYLRVLHDSPGHADALHLLGVLAFQAGRYDVAIEMIEQAMAGCSPSAMMHNNLANALRGAGRLAEAVKAYRRAIELDDAFADPHGNAGDLLFDDGNFSEAIGHYRRLNELLPARADLLGKLAVALRRDGDIPLAIATYREAVAVDPRFADGHINLGVLLKAEGKYAEAIAAFRRALAVDATLVAARDGLAATLHASGKIDEAKAQYRQAIAQAPDDATAHYSYSQLLLMTGEFERGWEEHEWRWSAPNFHGRRRNFPQPQWDGRPLAGRTLLLHAEQGLGDTIQFLRYLPTVAKRGGRILLGVQPELKALLAKTRDVEVVTESTLHLPAFDVQLPMMSLPYVLRLRGEATMTAPYLRADPVNAAAWKKQQARTQGGLHVGLAWAGGAGHPNDRFRSMTLRHLWPLVSMPGYFLYSLQKGPAAAQVAEAPRGMRLIDRTSELTSLADTAALIENLDLVITVDTVIAHLAGAMGKPVWILLPAVPDWRWQMNRPDTPLYPTARLFRQKTIGDWDSVIHRVTRALTEQIADV